MLCVLILSTALFSLPADEVERAGAQPNGDTATADEVTGLRKIPEAKKIWKLLGKRELWEEDPRECYVFESLGDPIPETLGKFTKEHLVKQLETWRNHTVSRAARWKFRRTETEKGKPSVCTISVEIYRTAEGMERASELLGVIAAASGNMQKIRGGFVFDLPKYEQQTIFRGRYAVTVEGLSKKQRIDRVTLAVANAVADLIEEEKKAAKKKRAAPKP